MAGWRWRCLQPGQVVRCVPVLAAIRGFLRAHSQWSQRGRYEQQRQWLQSCRWVQQRKLATQWSPVTSRLNSWGGRVLAGPDRALFLPGGLLDRSDLPSYLDGTLPGE
jgi:hypothetical protein